MRLYDYAASGNCYKARLLLSLTGREYERVPVDIFAGDTLTDGFGALSPLRETPVLELDSGETISQSNAILWYLADGTRFMPEGPLAQARAVQWLSFEQERVMLGIGSARFRVLTGRDLDAVPARLATGRGALEVLDAQLGCRDFVLGRPISLADISLFAYAHVAGDAGLDLARFPFVSAWIERIKSQPGFLDDFVPYPANASELAGRSIYG
jgi:glutathione S-transferase